MISNTLWIHFWRKSWRWTKFNLTPSNTISCRIFFRLPPINLWTWNYLVSKWRGANWQSGQRRLSLKVEIAACKKVPAPNSRLSIYLRHIGSHLVRVLPSHRHMNPTLQCTRNDQLAFSIHLCIALWSLQGIASFALIIALLHHLMLSHLLKFSFR